MVLPHGEHFTRTRAGNPGRHVRNVYVGRLSCAGPAFELMGVDLNRR